MNAQEIFDTVVNHLADQGTRSVMPDGQCAYRGDNGMKCAVGCLIPDEVYTPEMEGNTAYALSVNDMLPSELTDYMSLLTELQYAHDRLDSAAAIRNHLRVIAAQHRLDASSVKNIKEWKY